jgi:hypothetical protein
MNGLKLAQLLSQPCKFYAHGKAERDDAENKPRQCSDFTATFIGMRRNAPLSPTKEGARVHHSYGSYAPSTYGSYEPRRANPSTVCHARSSHPQHPRCRPLLAGWRRRSSMEHAVKASALQIAEQL